MPDILIRGMEMPERSDVIVQISSDGKAVLYPFLGEPRKVEVAELPEHGDLISRKALFDEVFKVWGVVYSESDCNTLMDLINDAPTIVPASKEVE